jgi:hypothetical protein
MKLNVVEFHLNEEYLYDMNSGILISIYNFSKPLYQPKDLWKGEKRLSWLLRDQQ